MKVKEFLRFLSNEHDAHFSNGLPKITVATTHLTKRSLQELQLNKDDRDMFRLFHTNAVLLELEIPACQCEVVETAINHAIENKIPVDYAEITCEGCGQKFTLPVPKNGCSEEMANIDITRQLINGDFDYLHMSTAFTPSIDQPGCGGCVYAGIGKWTVDKRAIDVINAAHSAMGFNKIKTFSDAHMRIMHSLYSHCFLTADLSHSTFIDCLTVRMQSEEGAIECNDDLLSSDEISEFVEWTLVAMAHHLAGDDEALLRNLRRAMQSLTPEGAGCLGCPRLNILAAAALLEALLPVRFAIFQVNLGPHALSGSSFDSACHDICIDPDSMIMQPVVLVAIAISATHFHKTVIQPGKGVCVKGIDQTLPGWLVASANRSEDTHPHSVTQMIRKWNDGNNDIFNCDPNSEEAAKF